MSGRLEQELITEQKMEIKLSELPNVFADFYYKMLAENKSYITASHYIDYVMDFMKYYTHNKHNDTFYLQVTPSDIDKYMASLRTKRINGKIVRVGDSIRAVRWSALKSFFDFVQSRDELPTNPVSKTTRPKITTEPEVDFLEQNEINLIINNIKNTANYKLLNRDLCIFNLGVATGVRVSAIANIDIDDVDLTNGIITVIEKGQKKRTIFIGDKLTHQIKLWLQDRETYFSGANTNALFISTHKTRINPDTINLMLKKYANGITDKNVHAHVMRHTAATMLYEATDDIYITSQMLGHANLQTTKRYAAMSTTKKKKATAILDSII